MKEQERQMRQDHMSRSRLKLDIVEDQSNNNSGRTSRWRRKDIHGPKFGECQCVILCKSDKWLLTGYSLECSWEQLLHQFRC